MSEVPLYRMVRTAVAWALRVVSLHAHDTFFLLLLYYSQALSWVIQSL